MMMRLSTLRNISEQDLAMLGLDSIGYLRPNAEGLALYAANGTPVAEFHDQKDAETTATENQLCLVSLH